MSSVNKNKIIDELCLAVARTLAEVEVTKETKGAGFYVWPMPIFHPTEGEIYTAPYLLPRLHKALVKLHKKGYDDQKIAQLFKNPSRIAQIVWLFTASEIVPLKREEKIDLGFKIVELISTYRVDPFCKKGKNILWSKKRVEENLKMANMIRGDKGKGLLSRLNGTAWLLCELLFFDFHGAGHEFHGPYELDSERILIVREYYDLRPSHWNFASGLPFSKVVILEVYNKCEIEFDLFNRARWTEPISEYLQEFSVSIDGKSVKELKKLNFVVNKLERTLKFGASKVAKMNKKELVKKFAESYFFIIKPLLEELGEVWIPPKSLYQDIDKEKKKGAIKEALMGLEAAGGKSQKEFIRILSKVFDPRR